MAALTIGAPVKWVDNTVSHFDLPGVTRRARGVERQIDAVGLLALAVCRLLQIELGVPLTTATRVARVIASQPRDAPREYRSSRLTIQFALAELERDLHERLRDAAESVATVRRGRPPKRSGPQP